MFCHTLFLPLFILVLHCNSEKHCWTAITCSCRFLISHKNAPLLFSSLHLSVVIIQAKMWKCRVRKTSLIHWCFAKQKEQMLQWLTLKYTTGKIVSSLLNTQQSHSVLCMIFLMHVATIQCLNYSGQESKKKKIKKLWFMNWFWHTCDLETRSWSSNLV